MKVFRTCCIIMKRRIVSLLLYFGLFTAFSVIMTSIASVTYSPDFSEMKPKFTIINRGADSPLIDGIGVYLRERGEEVILEDRKDLLQDATFYHATDYIIILPAGFSDCFLSGQPIKAETVTTTDSALGYYADNLVDQYLNLARIYLTANPQLEEKVLADTVLGDLSARAKVEKKHFGESDPVNANYHVFVRMTPYLTMVLTILCVSNITLAFRRPDVNMRNLCAPLKARSLGMQQILCYAMMSLAAFLVLNLTGLIQFGSKLRGADNRIIALILLNSFIFTVVATAIASLACAFVRGPNSQNAIANSLSLVLSFIGGVFVPLDMFGSGLLAISRFTPTFWYITTLEHACGLTSFDRFSLSGVWQGMLIQLAFAVSIFCVALAVNKRRSESEKSFVSVSTPLEA